MVVSCYFFLIFCYVLSICLSSSRLGNQVVNMVLVRVRQVIGFWMLWDSFSSRKKQNQSNVQIVQLIVFYRLNGLLVLVNDLIVMVQVVRLMNRQNQLRFLLFISRNWLVVIYRQVKVNSRVSVLVFSEFCLVVVEKIRQNVMQVFSMLIRKLIIVIF